MNLNTTVGVRAGSQDSYVAFASLADKIISDYHNVPVSSNMPINHPGGTPEATNWQKLNTPDFNSDNIKSVIFTICRSLESLKDCPTFGWAADFDQQEVKLGKIKSELMSLEN